MYPAALFLLLCWGPSPPVDEATTNGRDSSTTPPIAAAATIGRDTLPGADFSSAAPVPSGPLPAPSTVVTASEAVRVRVRVRVRVPRTAVSPAIPRGVAAAAVAVAVAATGSAARGAVVSGSVAAGSETASETASEAASGAGSGVGSGFSAFCFSAAIGSGADSSVGALLSVARAASGTSAPITPPASVAATPFGELLPDSVTLAAPAPDPEVVAGAAGAAGAVVVDFAASAPAFFSFSVLAPGAASSDVSAAADTSLFDSGSVCAMATSPLLLLVLLVCVSRVHRPCAPVVGVSRCRTVRRRSPWTVSRVGRPPGTRPLVIVVQYLQLALDVPLASGQFLRQPRGQRPRHPGEFHREE